MDGLKWEVLPPCSEVAAVFVFLGSGSVLRDHVDSSLLRYMPDTRVPSIKSVLPHLVDFVLSNLQLVKSS